MTGVDRDRERVLASLTGLRQYQSGGVRAPHKPLLVLLALGRLASTGTSQLDWASAHEPLGDLIAEFGPASKTKPAQSAAYPFTHLRSDGIWTLDQDVPMDRLSTLNATNPTGKLTPEVEDVLHTDAQLLASAARALVEAHFPPSVAVDVLAAVGLDPETILHAPDLPGAPARRRRDTRWREAVIQAWDRQCAFCGYDGQLGHLSVGLDAAHVRWFAFDGPDSLDNGLALCTLHHKLFNRGVITIDLTMRVCVSATYTARTHAGKAVYDLHHQDLRRRPGTPAPAEPHLVWHRNQVFNGKPLTL